MQALGYPATWPTHCFIACGAPVFAHTNGYGDFVLLDELGPPWPVHECYEDRFSLRFPSTPGSLAIRPDRLEEYDAILVPSLPAVRRVPSRDVKRVNPSDLVGQGELSAIGYVQDYVERRADRLAEKLTGIGQQLFNRVLGNRRSQITIVTSDLKSYTVFADLSASIIQRKDMICARLKAVRIFGLPDTEALFLADGILTLQGRR
jgi:hypothetical protein